MISDYLANLLLNYALGNSGADAVGPVYIALLTALPNRETASVSGEVSGGGYIRLGPVTFGSASGGKKVSDTAYTFAAPTADWATATGPIICVALMDAVTGGNWLFASPICPQIVLKGDFAPRFEVGSLKAMLGIDGGC